MGRKCGEEGCACADFLEHKWIKGKCLNCPHKGGSHQALADSPAGETEEKESKWKSVGRLQSAIMWMVQHGNDVARVDSRGRTLLHRACEEEAAQNVLEGLVKRAINVKAQDVDGMTALHVAAEKGSVKHIDFLLKNGCGIDIKDKDGRLAFHIAIYCGLLPIAKHLLSLSHNLFTINVSDDKGLTSLHHACWGRAGRVNPHGKITGGGAACVAVLEWLLTDSSIKIVIDNIDFKKRSALYLASKSGCSASVQALLAAGANPLLKAANGMSAATVAAKHGWSDCIMHFIGHSQIVPELVRELEDCILIASARGNQSVVDALASVGIEPPELEEEGETPLHTAAAAGDASRCDALLVEASSNSGRVKGYRGIVHVNGKNNDGRTSLHLAIANGHINACKTLLHHGANGRMEDPFGITPINICVFCVPGLARTSLVRLLVSDGHVDLDKRHPVYGMQPLHLAVELLADDFHDSGGVGEHLTNVGDASDALSLAECLLSCKADVDCEDINGSTPLLRALGLSHTDTLAMIKLLLKYGARSEKTDARGYTALHLALNLKANSEQIFLLLWESMSDDRKKASVDIRTSKDSFLRSLLHLAAKLGSEKIVNELLLASANVELKDSDNKTALHFAAEAGHNHIVSLLSKLGGEINAKSNTGWTTLYVAVYNNKLDMVKVLLEASANPDEKTDDGWAPLHAAAFRGFSAIIEALLKFNAIVDVTDKQMATPLFHATHGGFADIVKMLLNSGADPNCGLKNGWSPAHSAVAAGNRSILELLVGAKADLNIATKDTKETPVLVACREFDKNSELLLWMAATCRGIDFNVKDEETGNTPLYLATKSGKRELVTEIVKAGADLSIGNKKGRTPLHKAARRGNMAMVTHILSLGANCNAKDNRNDQPLHLAPGNFQLVKALVEAGADMNHQGHVGWSPVFRFVSIGCTDIVKYLIQNGSKPDIGNVIGDIPLHMAATDGNVELIRQLVSMKSSLSAEGFMKRQPLHSAAAAGNMLSCQELISLGANVHAKDGKGETPQQYAAKKGHKEVAKYLALQAGIEFDEGGVVERKELAPSRTYAAQPKKKVETKRGDVFERPPTPPPDL